MNIHKNPIILPLYIKNYLHSCLDLEFWSFISNNLFEEFFDWWFYLDHMTPKIKKNTLKNLNASWNYSAPIKVTPICAHAKLWDYKS